MRFINIQLSSFYKINSKILKNIFLLIFITFLLTIFTNSIINSSINSQLQSNLFGEEPYQAGVQYYVDGLAQSTNLGDKINWKNIENKITEVINSIDFRYLEINNNHDLLETTFNLIYYASTYSAYENPIPPQIFDAYIIEDEIFNKLLSNSTSHYYKHGENYEYRNQNINYTLFNSRYFDVIVHNTTKINLVPLNNSESYVVSSNNVSYTSADFHYLEPEIDIYSIIGVDFDSSNNLLIKKSDQLKLRDIPLASGFGNSYSILSLFTFEHSGLSLDNIDSFIEEIDIFLSEFSSKLGVSFNDDEMLFSLLKEINNLKDKISQINNEYILIAKFVYLIQVFIQLGFIIFAFIIVFYSKTEFKKNQKTFRLVKKLEYFNGLFLIYLIAIIFFSLFLAILSNFVIIKTLLHFSILSSSNQIFVLGRNFLLNSSLVVVNLVIAGYYLFSDEESKYNLTFQFIVLSALSYVASYLVVLLIEGKNDLRSLQLTWTLFTYIVILLFMLLINNLFTILSTVNSKLFVTKKSIRISLVGLKKLKKKMLMNRIVLKNRIFYILIFTNILCVLLINSTNYQINQDMRQITFNESPGEFTLEKGITFSEYTNYSQQLKQFVEKNNAIYFSIIYSESSLIGIKGETYDIVSYDGNPSDLAKTSGSQIINEKIQKINSMGMFDYFTIGNNALTDSFTKNRDYVYFNKNATDSVVLNYRGAIQEVPGFNNFEKTKTLFVHKIILDTMIPSVKSILVRTFISQLKGVETFQEELAATETFGNMKVRDSNSRIANINSLVKLIQVFYIFTWVGLALIFIIMYIILKREQLKDLKLLNSEIALISSNYKESNQLFIKLNLNFLFLFLVGGLILGTIFNFTLLVLLSSNVILKISKLSNYFHFIYIIPFLVIETIINLSIMDKE